MQFNKEQLQAVQHGTGPMLVLAGPGSGKTAVITGRLRCLLQSGVPDSSILVVTFTRAAAGEMKERFLAGQDRKTTQITFGTFHGVFYGILRHSYHISGNNILSEEDKLGIIRELLQEPDSGASEEAELPLQVAKEISRVKSANLDLKHYFSTSLSLESFEKVYKGYETWKAENHKLDFDDIMRECYRLFCRHPEILEQWQKKFRYILIDEFQDISPLQYRIIRMLAEPENNLFIVGDDDQSIYSFRGASPEIMLRFPKEYPETKQILLSENYRSTPEILESAGRLIAENRKRYRKNIHAAKASGQAVSMETLQTEREEMQHMIRQIRAGFSEGIPWKEQAVLLRTNRECRSVMEACMAWQVPFRMGEQIPCIYDHWIARDLLAYLHLAAGGRDRKDFLQICNRPNRYLSRSAFQEKQVSFENLYWYYEEKDWMCERVERLETDLKVISHLAPYGAIQYIRRQIGYEDYIREYALSHKIAVDELSEVLDELTESARDCKSTDAWKEKMEAFRETLRSNARREEGEPGVMICTLHASKGMEYDRVFIPNLNEGTIPYHKAVLDSELEEERRMLYVGMTRARKALYLYSVREKYEKAQKPSRFLDSILKR